MPLRLGFKVRVGLCPKTTENLHICKFRNGGGEMAGGKVSTICCLDVPVVSCSFILFLKVSLKVGDSPGGGGHFSCDLYTMRDRKNA